jgi:hypothetical protein
MPRNPSAFTAWFSKQHGPRPGGRKSDDALLYTILDGQLAERILDEREIWDARRESALYVWQQRDRG